MSHLIPSLLLALAPVDSSAVGTSAPSAPGSVVVDAAASSRPSAGSSSRKGGSSGGSKSSGSSSRKGGSSGGGAKSTGSSSRKGGGSSAGSSERKGGGSSAGSSERKGGSSSSSSSRPSGSSSSSSSSRPTNSGNMTTPDDANTQAPPVPQSGGTNSTYMPGNHGGAQATQPGTRVSPHTPSQTLPGGAPGSSSSRPGTTVITPDTPSQALPGGSSTRPGGSSSGSSRPSTSVVTPNGPGQSAGSTMPGGSSTRPSAGSSGAGSSAGHMPGNHGEVTPGAGSNWSGSQPGNSSNGGTRPGTDLERPDANQTRPSTGSGSATRPGSGSGSGSATRPSTGSGSSGATRPSTGGSNGGATRPDSGSRGSVRPDGPNAGRPGNTGRPSHTRPSTPGAHNHPHRPRQHTRPTTVVHNYYYGNRGPVVHRYHRGNVYWYHGVWVYGPRPVHHVYYNQTTTVQPEARPELPDRKVNRNDVFMLGGHATQMMGSYDGGGTWVDPGVGLSFAYRPVETFSIGLDYSYYNPTMDTEAVTPRETANISPNISVHAVPWKRVSPYAEFGLTASRRVYEDTWTRAGQEMEADVMGTAWGPHAALGLEVAIGKSVALDVSGKYIGYVNVEGADPSGPSALTASAGLNVYF